MEWPHYEENVSQSVIRDDVDEDKQHDILQIGLEQGYTLRRRVDCQSRWKNKNDNL